MRKGNLSGEVFGLPVPGLVFKEFPSKLLRVKDSLRQ